MIRLLPLLGVVLAAVFMLWLFAVTLPLTAPFVLAAAFALPARAIMRLIEKRQGKRGLPHKAAALFATLALVLTAVSLIVFILVRASGEIIEFALRMPANVQGISGGLQAQLEAFIDSLGFLTPDVQYALKTSISDLSSLIAQGVNSLAIGAWRVLTSIPQSIIFIVVFVLSIFFITADYGKFAAFVKKQLPQSAIDNIRRLKNDLFSAILSYIRAQLILMCVAFTILTAGFLLLGVRYALLFALIIAVVDALPVFGAGLFLIPGTAYFLLTGETLLGIGLGIIYICLIIVRQTLEPRLVGRRIGVHPLLTMVSMYAGLKIYGVLGMLLGPLTAVVLRNVIAGYMGGRTIRELMMEQGADDGAG